MQNATTIALAAVLASGCSAVLHRTAQVSEVLALGSLACDAGSTDTAVRGGYREHNPVMGPHPETAAVAAYFASVGGAVFGLNRVSRNWVRVVGNLTMVAVEVVAERGNYAGGVPTCGIGSR